MYRKSIASILYIHALASLLYPESLKKIVSIYITIAIIFEVILVYLLFTNISMVGTKVGLFSPRSGTIPLLFILFVLVSVLVFTIMFIRVCLKSPEKKNQLRGKFFIISVILFVVGSFLDTISLNVTMLIITRLLLITRLFFAYLAWLMPTWVANKLIKED